MLSISKRRLLQLAGVSIADRVMPRWLRAAPQRSPRTDRKVILVTFGGGVRYSETFAPEGLRNIPRLAALRPQGHFFRTCANSGTLSHFNSSASIVTGNWQHVDDFGLEPPATATIFEQFRKQSGAGPMDAWVIATNKSFAQIGWGSERSLGAPFGANVVLPKQLLLDAVGEAVKGGGAGVTSRE